jgi:3-oxoacyl-[acyl-carrier-protein] synthase II
MTARPVVITGLGAISPLGDAPDTIFEALCEGRRTFAPPTTFPAEVAPGIAVAEVPDFNPQRYIKVGNLRPLDRTGRLALVGIDFALTSSGWTPERRAASPLGLAVGTMFCSVKTIAEFDRRAQQAGPEYASPMDFSNTVLNAAAGQVAIWERLRGMNTTISAGTTSGVQAIGYAAEQIRTGYADALVAGGVEEVCFESAFGFQQADRLTTATGRRGVVSPFDAERDGTAMGEGSAFFVLESEAAARARGAQVLGRVLGFANGFDPDTRTPGAARPGAVLAAVIRRALADAAVSASDIGFIESSASGAPELDAREASALAAVFGSSVPVGAVKSMLGESLGASGAFQTLTALLALRSERQPGVAGLARLDPSIPLSVTTETRPVRATRALVTSMAPEGTCCALVLAID